MTYVDSRTEVEKLQDFFSDFHKEVYGFRPRFLTAEGWNSAEILKAEIQKLHDSMDRMKQTREGRNELRDQGWYIASPSAEEDGWVDYAEQCRLELEAIDLAAQQAEAEEQAMQYPGKKYEHLQYLEAA